MEEVDAEVELPNDGIDKLLDAWNDLQLRGEINKETEMMDYIAVDDEVITGWD